MPDPPKLAAASPNLVALLQRLGVYGEDSGMPWWFSDVILPVAIVDAGQVTISATAAPFPMGLPASAGLLTAPAINTIWADTGQLAPGTWDLLVWVSSDDAAATWQLQRQDSTNTVTLWRHRFGIPTPGAAVYDSMAGRVLGPYRVKLANNERIRILGETAVAAGRVVIGNIWTNGPF
jgi:hypothetical protein